MAKSCSTCSAFLRCKRPERAKLRGCDEYITFQLPSSAKQMFSDILGADIDDYEEQNGVFVRSAAAKGKLLIDDKEAEEAEDSLIKIVDDILNEQSGSGLVPPDIRVDDRDLKEYPNFFRWSIEPKASGIRPFARQMWIGAHVFSEVCVPCSKDKKWASDIHSVAVDASLEEVGERIQFLEYGVCPKCKRTKVDLFKSKQLDPYQELCLVIGQRAGKSAMSGFFSGYHVHKILKLQNPNQVYGLPLSQTLTGTFVGLTFSAAIKLLWLPLTTLINQSPWFIEYHKMLDDVQKRYHEELSKRSDQLLHYKHRNLLLFPAGGDKRKLRGESRIIAAMDELGWWPLGSGREEDLEKSGSEVYNAIDRSLLTIRQAAISRWKEGYVNVPMAYFFNVSSPSSWLDMIMRLYRASLNSRKMLGLQMATWEVNPNLPEKVFAADFAKDPIKARRDYGAQPPASSNPFIENNDAIDASFKLNPSKVQFHSILVPGTDYTRQRVKLDTNYKQNSDMPASLMAIDAGAVNNSFAMVVGTLVRSANPKELATARYPVLIEIIPKQNSRLSFNSIFDEIIVPVAQACNVRALVADRWNSLMLLDRATEEYGIYTEQYSVKRGDFDLAKSYLDGGKEEFPQTESKVKGGVVDFNPEHYPSVFENRTLDHFYLQIHTVTDAGRYVEKGTGLTDDLFRAWVLATRFMRDQDFADKYLVGTKVRTGMVALGVVSGRSGGGGGSGGGGDTSRIGVVSSRLGR